MIIVSIDSTFIPNKICRIDNELINMNSFYKNKYGIKITAITIWYQNNGNYKWIRSATIRVPR